VAPRLESRSGDRIGPGVAAIARFLRHLPNRSRTGLTGTVPAPNAVIAKRTSVLARRGPSLRPHRRSAAGSDAGMLTNRLLESPLPASLRGQFFDRMGGWTSGSSLELGGHSRLAEVMPVDRAGHTFSLGKSSLGWHPACLPFPPLCGRLAGVSCASVRGCCSSRANPRDRGLGPRS
jgi:hypothetical protein